MSTLEEIKKYFASLTHGAVLLKSLPEQYPAYTIRTQEGFGVAIPWNEQSTISEHFANAHFYSTKLSLGGEESNYLILQSFQENLRNEFACVCTQLIDPGENGRDRIDLVSNPLSWWEHWKNLLGNAIADKTPYSVLCELIVLEHLYSFDNSAQWTASKNGTHDIETDTRSIEVKSTIRRYGADITVSGQFQLLSPKPLLLYFCRMEESPSGTSINDITQRLVKDGYDTDLIESQLSIQGYEKGASIRDKKYSVLEKRMYIVDDGFPKIISTSFKENKIPNNITHITYTIDLEGLPFETW